MHTSKRHSGRGTAAAAAPAIDHQALESALGQCPDADRFCSEVAKLFHVRRTEVALLRLEKGLLRFLFPDELKIAGSIPISSATAVAAHTVVTKKVELFNSFTKVKHAAIFETVKLGKAEDADPADRAPIQKLISAPVLSGEGRVLGVLQVCRKGLDLNLAGADFTFDDLHSLEAAAQIAARAEFLQTS